MRSAEANRAAPTVTLAHTEEGPRLIVLATNPVVRARLLAAGFAPRRDGELLVAPVAPSEVPPCR